MTKFNNLSIFIELFEFFGPFFDKTTWTNVSISIIRPEFLEKMHKNTYLCKKVATEIFREISLFLSVEI